MKVFDCINFFNEHELFDIRYQILKNSVDFFVVIEGSKKFNGKDNKFCFRHELYDKKKIIYIKINEYNDDIDIFKYPSHLDDQSKNRILDGLYAAQYNDIILISDCDEIPHPKTIEKIKKIKNSKIGICFQKMIYFDYKHLAKTYWFWFNRWPGTRFMKFQNLIIPKSLRWYHQPRLYDPRNYLKYNIILDKGFHFSWIGDIDQLVNKYKTHFNIHDLENKNKNLTKNKAGDEKIKEILKKNLEKDQFQNPFNDYQIKKVEPNLIYDNIFYDILNKKDLI